MSPKRSNWRIGALVAALSTGPAGVYAAGLSLKHLPTPEPSNLNDFVKDRNAALVLGKALFWDMQVGSDGVQACASCHFNAGADSRAKNQISPGLLRSHQNASPNPDTTFVIGPNYKLKPSDFPLRKLANVHDRSSAVLDDRNDIVSSQGVMSGLFENMIPGFPVDVTSYLADPDGFQVNRVNVRRVEPRNTPTTINAVFNFRNFWDGRAQNDFNGVNPFGSRDPNAFLFKSVNDNLVQTRVSLNNSSLASQAVGPPGNPFEMSARNRSFPKIGVKLLSLRPLGLQQVASDDSVLGSYNRGSAPGLNVPNYKQLVKAAFNAQWYDSSQYIRVNVDGSTTLLDAVAGRASKRNGENTYTQAEYNFSLFFGLAVQMYEATLVSNDTPFDRFLDGDTTAITPEQVLGFALFGNDIPGSPSFGAGPARCANCHGGIETTDASVTKVGAAQSATAGPLRRRQTNVIDLGFNNIGVTPTLEDLGVGGLDPFGNPLSVARKAFLDPNDPNRVFLRSTDVFGADGGFKIPSLRNVELTAPYFHNGGAATLSEVIDFYFRGGDHQSVPIGLRAPANNAGIPTGALLQTGALLGFDPLRLNAVQIRPLGTLTGVNFDNVPAQDRPFNETDKQALLAFLASLTDERVKYRKAPFDHPQLFIPNGHIGNESSVINVFGNAADNFKEIPATGRNGGAPLPAFLEF